MPRDALATPTGQPHGGNRRRPEVKQLLSISPVHLQAASRCCLSRRDVRPRLLLMAPPITRRCCGGCLQGPASLCEGSHAHAMMHPNIDPKGLLW